MRHAAFGIVAALALAAMGWTQGAAAKELRIGVKPETVSLDPHVSLQPPDMQIGRHFFDNLIFFDEMQRLTPALATSWTQLDAKTWEFKLRRDVKWHDGSPFTADDVLFSFSREGKIEGATNSPLRFITNGRKSIEKIDDYTVRIRTADAYVLTPEDIAVFGIVSKKHGQGAKPADYDSGKAMIGTGPYRFVEFVRGDRLVMEANPNWWGGKPSWDRVVIKPIRTDASRVAALLSGDVDLIDYVPPADIAGLRGNAKLALHSGPSNRAIYLAIDSARDVSPFVKTNDGQPLFPNPLRDWRVRKAMSLAIDRAAMVERIMDGAGIPAAQMLPDGFFGVSPNLKVEAFDLAGARKLLEAAGYGGGFELTLHGPNDRYVNDTKVLQTAAQMLTRLGLKVKVETMPRSIYFPRSRAFDYSAGLWGYSTDTGEVGSSLNNVLACANAAAGAGNANVGRYCNPRFDEALVKALGTIEIEKRKALLQEASEIAMRDLGVIPLFYLVNVWASRADLKYAPRTDEYTLANDVRPAR